VALHVSFDNEAQFKKHSASIEVTPLGITMLFNLVQPENASNRIVFNALGSVIEERLVQLEKQ
jgi:hypothetical protein